MLRNLASEFLREILLPATIAEAAAMTLFLFFVLVALAFACGA